jgi:hypothetical protein
MAEQQTTADKRTAPSISVEEASRNLRNTGIVTGEAGETDAQRTNSDASKKESR